MKLKTILAGLALMGGLASSAASDPMGAVDTVTPGVWCSNFTAAKEYADKNNVPMLVFWANPGCSQCAKLESACKRSDFVEWMEETQMIFVFGYGTSTADAKACKEFAKNETKAFPYIVVYWKSNTDGEQVLQRFTGRSGKMGASKSLSLDEQLMTVTSLYLLDWDPDGGSVTPTPTPTPDPDPTPTPGSITYTASDVNVAYDGEAHGISVRVTSPSSAKVEYAESANGTWGTTPLTLTGVGSETVYYRISADGYTTVTGSKKVTIAKREVTLKSSSATKKYDGSALVSKTVTVSGFVGTDGVTYEVTGSQTEVGSSKNTFTYVLNNGTDAANYEIETVEGTLTVTAAKEPVNLKTVYNKARSFTTVISSDDGYVGTATLKIGRINSRKGTVKVSLSGSLFSGKRISTNTTLVPDEYGTIEGTFKLASSLGGAMDFELTYDSDEKAFAFGAENDTYVVEMGEVQLGGSFETDELSFSAEADVELPEDYDFVVDMPMDEPVYVKKGTKLSCGKAASISYKKVDGEYELSGTDNENRPNLSGLKVSYNSKTGVFKGSFTVYASNEGMTERKPTLKKYKASFSGLVINGSGVGIVTVKVGKVPYYGTCSLD